MSLCNKNHCFKHHKVYEDLYNDNTVLYLCYITYFFLHCSYVHVLFVHFHLFWSECFCIVKSWNHSEKRNEFSLYQKQIRNPEKN